MVAQTRIVIVGCGPGSMDFITPAAKRACESVQVILGAPRLLELFADIQVRRMELPAQVGPALEILSAEIKRGDAAVLVSGDPGLRSLAKPVVQRFGKDRCEIIPAVSSIQLAFARLAQDWTDALILSAHSQLPDISARELAKADKVAILAGTNKAMQWISEMTTDLDETHKAFVCEDLGLEGERIREKSPSRLTGLDVSTRTIVILVKKELL